MHTLYAVLGLRPEARDDEIKTAFRKLAKQYHPDLHPADERAEQRFKEINEAHAILTDVHARARYDARLSQERSLRLQRLRNAAATMAVSCALMVTATWIAIVHGSGLLLGAYRSEPPATISVLENGATPIPVGGRRTVALARPAPAAETALSESPVDGGLVESPSAELRWATPPDKDTGSEGRVQETKRVEMEQQEPPSARDRSTLPDAGKSRERTLQIEPPAKDDRGGRTDTGMARAVQMDETSWDNYRDARFGFAIRYPANIFVLVAAQSDEHVKRFRSRDGRASLRIFGTPNLAGRTPAQYRAALIRERYPKATFDYAPKRDTWFVLSGVAGKDIFYERVTFACDKRSFHGWMLVFPSSERLLYEPIIEEMHRKYRHSNGPGARCGAVKGSVSARTKTGGG